MEHYEDGCYGSLPGIALIGKVLAGRCKMHYTRVAAGKGAIPEGVSPKAMTEPAGYVMDARISGITNPVDGECQITVQINSADVENGFYCTGLLLYAEDPDEGEVPYTYLVLENEPEWIRPASSIVGKLATFDIIAAVGDVDAVTAAIDPDTFATVGEMRRMVEEEVAKQPGGGYTAILDLTLPAESWVADDTLSSDYKFICDVACGGITSEMYPVGSAYLESIEVSRAAEMACSCETFDGYIRFYAKRRPTADIRATVALFEKSGGHGGGGDSGGVLTLPITIPATGWTKDESDTTGYPWHIDIANASIKEDMTPLVTALRESLSVAVRAGICPTVETRAGVLRIYSRAVPEAEIFASLALMGSGQGGGGVETGDGLTRDAEGKLAVKIGSGLTFDVNRAVAADPQTVVTDDDLLNEDETEQDLKEILLR